jgi:hypothetical protein
MEGGCFLIQRVELGEIKGIEIIGHESKYGKPPSEEIKSRYFGGAGDTLD